RWARAEAVAWRLWAACWRRRCLLTIGFVLAGHHELVRIRRASESHCCMRVCHRECVLSASGSVPKSQRIHGMTSDDSVSFLRRLGSVATLSLGHAVNDSYAYMLQAVLPALVGSLGLTLGMAGGLVSLYQVTSSLIQPAIGYVADRSALRWPAWVGVGMSALSAGLMVLAPNYGVLAAVVLLGGLGTAIFHPVSAAMAGASAPASSRGRWLGVYVTAGSFGLAFGPKMIDTLVQDGQVALAWPVMLPGLATAGIVALLAPRVHRGRHGAASLRETLERHGRVLGALVLVTGLRAWASAAIVTFIPLLATSRGASLDDGATTLTAYLLARAARGLPARPLSPPFGP